MTVGVQLVAVGLFHSVVSVVVPLDSALNNPILTGESESVLEESTDTRSVTGITESSLNTATVTKTPVSLMY